MIEFLLCLPLLGLMLFLILHLGWAHMRRQRTVVADRYTVWKQIDGAAVSDQTLNERFLTGKAVGIDQQASAGPTDAIDYWVDQTDEVDVEAGDLADELLVRRWPHGRQVDLEVEYDTHLAVTREFYNPLSSRHGREGVEWRRGEARVWDALRDGYYADLDEGLQSIGGMGQGFAERIRSLYAAQW